MHLGEGNNSFWREPKYRYYRIAVFFVILVLLTELGVRIYFARPGIIERNPGNTTAAMSYLLEQVDKHEGRKIVFLGSSVVQGYGNCVPGTHVAKLVEAKLHERGMNDVACFNLSSAGNRFGDHFGNLIESMRYKPDLVIQSVHVKMFSVHASLVDPFTHDEVIYYFRNEPEVKRTMQQRFEVRPDRYRQIWLDFQMRKLSGLYRYRGLMQYFFTGNYKKPATTYSDRIKADMGWMDPLLVEAHDTTQEERNADYLWKVIPQHVVQLNYHHCEAFDFSDENINWKTFREYNAYAETRNVNLIMFLNPVNKPFVQNRNFFNWDEVIPLYKRRTLRVCQKHGTKLVDAVDQINPRFFSDLDHLNMNGHEQLAELLLPTILDALKKRK